MMNAIFTDYRLLIFAVLAVLIVISLIKSAWKLLKFALVIGAAYLVLVYFGIL